MFDFKFKVKFYFLFLFFLIIFKLMCVNKVRGRKFFLKVIWIWYNNEYVYMCREGCGKVKKIYRVYGNLYVLIID